jgi:hypothetical protein
MKVHVEYSVPNSLVLELNENEVAAFNAGMSTDDFNWFADEISDKVAQHAMAWFVIDEVREILE